MENNAYYDLKAYVLSKKLPKTFPSTKPNFLATAAHYKVNLRGFLTREGKIVLKKSDLPRLWKQYHDHCGSNPTWNRIKSKYYYYGGEKWVRSKTQDCVACSHKNSSVWPVGRAPLNPIPVTPKAFWRVHLDLMGPLAPVSLDGNRYVGIAVDALTKYPEALGKLHKLAFILGLSLKMKKENIRVLKL